ncbi:MAG: GAF domain-containing sensor histidine kinase [Prochlorothrix sp.]
MLDNRLFCAIDDRHAPSREQERLLVLANSGLLDAKSFTIFEEAIQTAAKILEMPFGWIGFMERDRLSIKAAVGLHRLGLMNTVTSHRVIKRLDTFCTHVVDSLKPLHIPDTRSNPAFLDSPLAQEYGIRAYIGIPLLLSSGHCIGTLALMDEKPHIFEERDIYTLNMFSRWCVSEAERERMVQINHQVMSHPNYADMWEELDVNPPPLSQFWAMVPDEKPQHPAMNPEPPLDFSTQLLPLQARLRLVHQLADQLTSPLTAILGMANILGRGIYGNINSKQQEYLNVIQDSGHTLRLWSQEILELAQVEDLNLPLQTLPLDVEALCEQVLHHVQDVIVSMPTTVKISREPGQRIWSLDRDKMRKMLYNIIYGLVQTVGEKEDPDSILRLHIAQKQGQLRLTFWFSHPWLDDGSIAAINPAPMPLQRGLGSYASGAAMATATPEQLEAIALEELEAEIKNLLPVRGNVSPKLDIHSNRPSQLRLLLCQYWAELQGGKLWMQDSPESGLRYIISLPSTPVA